MKIVKMRFAFTIDDVGLQGYSSVEGFKTILGFLKEQNILGTFMVVPFSGAKPINEAIVSVG